MGIASEDGLNRISLRIPDELFERLKKKRFETDISFQDVGLELFRQWAEGKAQTLPPDDPIVDSLREFLAIAEPADVRALRVSIEVFLRDARRHPRGGKHKRA
jgi:hypothetical protein